MGPEEIGVYAIAIVRDFYPDQMYLYVCVAMTKAAAIREAIWNAEKEGVVHDYNEAEYTLFCSKVDFQGTGIKAILTEELNHE